jgi:hypothetical protein
MTLTIKPERKACVVIAFATIALLPAAGFAKSKAILTTDLLQNLRKGEPWNRSVFTATKAVMFEQAASGGTDATSIAKITLSYFTSPNCSGTGQGNDTGSLPNPSYTTPNGTSYTISVGPPGFGLVAASVWNVGNAKLAISDANMANIQSIAVTFKSTNNNTPQANFTGVSFACLPVTCTAGPGGQCTSASGTQSFILKTTAAIGDPANGGVIACLDGGLNNLVAGSLDSAQAFNPGIVWGGSGTAVGVTAQSDTDGATNTTAIVTALGVSTTFAAGLCQAYATTVDTGGYNTWFLPAKDQLNCLYTNRVAIGNFDLAGVPLYWSSTELAGNPSNAAWFQTFVDGTQSGPNKSNTFGARCVQAFTP